MERLLGETIKVDLQTGTISKRDLGQIMLDITVQEKPCIFPPTCACATKNGKSRWLWREKKMSCCGKTTCVKTRMPCLCVAQQGHGVARERVIVILQPDRWSERARKSRKLKITKAVLWVTLKLILFLYQLPRQECIFGPTAYDGRTYSDGKVSQDTKVRGLRYARRPIAQNLLTDFKD